MSYGRESRLKSGNSKKSAKRVRFSDEIEKVHEFESYKENQPKYFAMSSNQNLNSTFRGNNCDATTVVIEEPTLHKSSVENEVLGVDSENYSCNKNSIIIEEITTTSLCDKNENSNYIISDSEEFKNDSSNTEVTAGTEHEMTDLTDLITSTNQLSISRDSYTQPYIISIEDVSSTNNCPELMFSETLSSQKSTMLSQNEPVMSYKLDETSQSDNYHKRSYSSMCMEKQTSKLNSLLNQDHTTFNSANELKSAVFHAWHKIKNENIIQSSVSPAFLEKDTVRKHLVRKSFDSWKRSKFRLKQKSEKKCEKASTATETEKSKNDAEESKMAFKAWKRHKDELLKRHLKEKYRKEEENKYNTVVAEKVRKNDAECAYTAWKTHKSTILKLERRRKEWLEYREKEKIHQKVNRNEEAAQNYSEWLKKKTYSKNYKKSHIYKPPWTPPGKLNNSF